jgi:hypothetical protein
VNAVNGAGIDAGGVLRPNAGFGDDVCHGPPQSCHHDTPYDLRLPQWGQVILRYLLERILSGF